MQVTPRCWRKVKPAWDEDIPNHSQKPSASESRWQGLTADSLPGGQKNDLEPFICCIFCFSKMPVCPRPHLVLGEIWSRPQGVMICVRVVNRLSGGHSVVSIDYLFGDNQHWQMFCSFLKSIIPRMCQKFLITKYETKSGRLAWNSMENV